MPFTEHLRSLFEHTVADGIKPGVIDGRLYLHESEQDGVMAVEHKDGLRHIMSEEEYERSLDQPTGDAWFDAMMDEVDSGKDDFKNPLGDA